MQCSKANNGIRSESPTARMVAARHADLNASIEVVIVSVMIASSVHLYQLYSRHYTIRLHIAAVCWSVRKLAN
jgi:hypothetical protein